MDELFIIDQYKLFNLTQVIAKTIPDKAIIPAHEFIRIKNGYDNSIEISAANSENNTSITIEGVLFDKPFDIAIEYSFLKPLKKREIDLSFYLDNKRCVITCVNSRWEVPVIDSKDVPEMVYVWEPLFEIDGPQLKEILSTVSPFALNELTASISNIHFKSEDDYLSIGASSRFSCASFSYPIKTDKDISFMLSKDSCDLITNIIDTGNVYVYKGADKAVKFVTTHGSVTSVLPTFEDNPVNNYHKLSQRYLERPHDTIKIPDKAYFKEQIRKAAAFSPMDKSILSIDITDNKLLMHVEDFMIGRKSDQDVDILYDKEGTADKVIVSYQHLLRVIANSFSLDMDIEIPLSNGPGGLCIVEPLVIKDEGFTYLIMPLSL